MNEMTQQEFDALSKAGKRDAILNGRAPEGMSGRELQSILEETRAVSREDYEALPAVEKAAALMRGQAPSPRPSVRIETSAEFKERASRQLLRDMGKAADR
jgi:hypothetical protein